MSKPTIDRCIVFMDAYINWASSHGAVDVALETKRILRDVKEARKVALNCEMSGSHRVCDGCEGGE